MALETWYFEPITEGVMVRVHALNQRYQYFLSPLNVDELRAILGQCFYHRCAGDGEAFIIAMHDGADYSGVNFQWFAKRYDSFVYVDRIAVGESLQRRGLAQAFYSDLEDASCEAGREFLCAEVDLEPPNQGSLDFHDALGFERVGTGEAKRKTVQYFAKLLVRPGSS